MILLSLLNNLWIVARKQAKIDDAKATTDTAAKQLRMEEADTFRGVHLDPNAHHWDEVWKSFSLMENFHSSICQFRWKKTTITSLAE